MAVTAPSPSVVVDLVAGTALVAGRSVPVAPVGDDGALRVGGVGGVVLRPLSFGARARLVASAARAVDPAAALVVGIVGSPAPAPASAEVAAVALWLAGADSGAPPFAVARDLVRGALGCSEAEIDRAEAALVDRLAVDLSPSRPAAPDDGWTRIVFGDEEPAAAVADTDSAVGDLVAALAQDLLDRGAGEPVDESETLVASPGRGALERTVEFAGGDQRGGAQWPGDPAADRSVGPDPGGVSPAAVQAGEGSRPVPAAADATTPAPSGAAASVARGPVPAWPSAAEVPAATPFDLSFPASAATGEAPARGTGDVRSPASDPGWGQAPSHLPTRPLTGSWSPAAGPWSDRRAALPAPAVKSPGDTATAAATAPPADRPTTAAPAPLAAVTLDIDDLAEALAAALHDEADLRGLLR